MLNLYLQSFSNFTGNTDDRGVCQCSVILPDNTFPVLRVERLEITAQTISKKFEKELSKVSLLLFASPNNTLFVTHTQQPFLQGYVSSHSALSQGAHLHLMDASAFSSR